MLFVLISALHPVRTDLSFGFFCRLRASWRAPGLIWCWKQENRRQEGHKHGQPERFTAIKGINILLHFNTQPPPRKKKTAISCWCQLFVSFNQNRQHLQLRTSLYDRSNRNCPQTAPPQTLNHRGVVSGRSPAALDNGARLPGGRMVHFPGSRSDPQRKHVTSRVVMTHRWQI